MPDRLSRLRTTMKSLGMDAFLVSSLPHLRYLFSFTGSAGIAFITRESCILIIDNRYREQAGKEVENAQILIAAQGLFVPVQQAGFILPEMKIGFEAAHLTFDRFSQLHKAFPKNALLDSENLIENIVVQKEPVEIEKTRQACKIACSVFPEVLTYIKPGVRECDIAAEISYRCRRAGADGDAFEPIVASGWRGALPHGIASQKMIKAGELVVIDFGCKWQGFNSDITRTVAVSEPGEELRRMYEAVKNANILARNGATHGISAIELDGFARDFLRKEGFTSEFSHSLGHGLGIEVHSMPRIGPKSKDNIPTECIITIEPGLYKPGLGGVRIEDDLYIGQNKVEVLTPLDRELLILD